MEERINKYLSEAGYCSRREADRLVEAGKVTIDGVAAVCGSKVADGQSQAGQDAFCLHLTSRQELSARQRTSRAVTI